MIPSELNFVERGTEWRNLIPYFSDDDKQSGRGASKLIFSGPDHNKERNDPAANALAFLGSVHIGDSPGYEIYGGPQHMRRVITWSLGMSFRRVSLFGIYWGP
jgi:hypothetical protein